MAKDTGPRIVKPETQIEVAHYAIEWRPGRGKTVTAIIRAGNRGTERIVPPAGEEYAFDRQLWARRIDVSVSPTGRSVRVFVDGKEVPKR